MDLRGGAASVLRAQGVLSSLLLPRALAGGWSPWTGVQTVLFALLLLDPLSALPRVAVVNKQQNWQTAPFVGLAIGTDRIIRPVCT